MNRVKLRAAASLLSLVFVLTLLPTAALAAEREEDQIVAETVVEEPVVENGADGVSTDEQADEAFTPPDEPGRAVDTEDPTADETASLPEDEVDSDGADLEAPAQGPLPDLDEEAAEEAPDEAAEAAEMEENPVEEEPGAAIESGLRELTSGTYVLTRDVDLSANSGLTTYSVSGGYDFIVPEGVVVTIDLDGYTLTGSGDGPVIYVLGTLYLSDSSGGAGVVTGGYQSSDTSVNTAVGGGVYVADGGTFVMTGGVITGNTAYSGGGVYVDGGTFRFEGGEISGNEAVGNPSDKYGVGDTVPGAGGGVYVADGVFEMTGGQISDNQATRTGGGIYLGGDSEASISGGSVTGNVITYQYSLGGGIAYVGGTLTLSGNPYIYGNSRNYGSSSNACNLLIGESNWNSGSLLVLSGDLDLDAVIGLFLLANQKPAEGQTVPVTASEAGTSWYKTAYPQFVPDDSSLYAAYDDEGRQVVIGYRSDFAEEEDPEPDEEIYNVYFVIPNGVGGSFAPHNEGDPARYTTTVAAAQIPFGGVTYRVEFPQITVSEGYILTGWNIVGVVTETWAPETWMIEDVQNYAKGYDLVVEAVIEAVKADTPPA